MPAVPFRKVLRTVLPLFAVVALVGACGSDDDEAETTTTEADETTTTEAEEETTTTEADSGDEGDVCALLDPADLSEATGTEFVNAEPAEASCLYSSADGSSVISLNVTTLGGAPGEVAVDAAVGLCDEGTAADIEFTSADAGFGCLVSGVPTVGAAGDDAFAVLTGLTLDPSISSDQIISALATILENAISG